MSKRFPEAQPGDYGIRPLLALDGTQLEAPPRFEDLIGYGGERRHIAFYWCAGDCPVVEDGVSSATGHYGPWLYWSRHPAVQPSLVGIDYGSCDGPPVQHVLLDRFSRRLFAGPAADVTWFLADAPDLRAEREAWEALSEEEKDEHRRAAGDAMRELVGELLDPEGWEEVGGTVEEHVAADETFERGAVPRLREWLDARPLPCPSCSAPHVAADYGPAAGTAPACPSCGEPFYSQALLDRLAELRAGGDDGAGL